MIPPPPFEVLSLWKGVWKPFILNILDIVCFFSLISQIPNTCSFLFSGEVSIRFISENLLISFPQMPCTFKTQCWYLFFLRFNTDESNLLALLSVCSKCSFLLDLSSHNNALWIILNDLSIYCSEIMLLSSMSLFSSLSYKFSVQVQLNKLHSTHKLDKLWYLLNKKLLSFRVLVQLLAVMPSPYCWYQQSATLCPNLWHLKHNGNRPKTVRLKIVSHYCFVEHENRRQHSLCSHFFIPLKAQFSKYFTKGNILFSESKSRLVPEAERWIPSWWKYFVEVSPSCRNKSFVLLISTFWLLQWVAS